MFDFIDSILMSTFQRTSFSETHQQTFDIKLSCYFKKRTKGIPVSSRNAFRLLDLLPRFIMKPRILDEISISFRIQVSTCVSKKGIWIMPLFRGPFSKSHEVTSVLQKSRVPFVKFFGEIVWSLASPESHYHSFNFNFRLPFLKK